VQALQGKDITIYGDGTQTRSFCYVDDLVEGIRRVFELPDSLDSPVNLGNPSEFSMIELANKVIAISGSKSKIEFEVLPEDDPKQRKPDIQKARELLGWQPSIELDKGIEKTTIYFRKVLGL
jgi:UDP-glucuronate decarboxylase